MEQPQLIKPDIGFIKEIIRRGGDSVKRCFQCSNCTAVCLLSPPDKPFPRKEMIWVQWGLKERLIYDPDIWLCHRCADCSANCPRGAKPGDVMAAIRSYATEYLSVPRFFSQLFSHLEFLPIPFIISAFLFLAYFWVRVIKSVKFPLGMEIVGYKFSFLPFINAAAIILLVVMFIPIITQVFRFWININRFQIGSPPKRPWARSIILAFKDLLTHYYFQRCNVNKINFYSHLLIFYGFILIFIAFIIFLFNTYIFNVRAHYPLISPIKITGNLGALLLIGGLALNIYMKFTGRAEIKRAFYFDWFLVILLLLVAISGVAAQALRMAWPSLASPVCPYAMYLTAIHIWLVFTLFLYAAYYKFSHIFYRFLALLYAKRVGREILVRSIR